MNNQKNTAGVESIHIGCAALFPGKLFYLKKDLPESAKIKILNGDIPGESGGNGITSVNSCWFTDGRIVVPDNILNHPVISRVLRGGRPSPEGPLKPTFVLKAVERHFKNNRGEKCVILPCNIDGTAPLGSITPVDDNGILAFVNNITSSITIMLVVEEQVTPYKHLAHVSMKKFTVGGDTGEVKEEVIGDSVAFMEEDMECLTKFVDKFGEKYGDAFIAALDILQSMAEEKPQTAMWVQDITRPIADPVPDAPMPAEEPAPMPATEAKGKGKKAGKQQPSVDAPVGNNGHDPKVTERVAANEIVA